MPELKTTEFITNENLKAYYRFESGALTTDSSGEGNSLIAISDPAEDASGKFGGAAAFDGNDAYYLVSADNPEVKPTGSFTIGAWVNMSAYPSSDNVVFFQSYSQNSNVAGFFLEIRQTTGKLRFLSGKNTGTTDNVDFDYIDSDSAIGTGWHFCVAVWDGSYLRIYIDGTSAATAIAWANAPAYAASSYFRIGCQNLTGADIAFFTGSLDDVFLLNGTALSANQIKSLYEGNNFFQLF